MIVTSEGQAHAARSSSSAAPFPNVSISGDIPQRRDSFSVRTVLLGSGYSPDRSTPCNAASRTFSGMPRGLILAEKSSRAVSPYVLPPWGKSFTFDVLRYTKYRTTIPTRYTRLEVRSIR